MHPRSTPRALAALAATVLVLLAPTGLAASEASPRNVLLILFDDLRAVPTERPILTPSLDQFANRAIEFTHAYAQQPSCNPSRTSLLTGLRPSTTGIVDNEVFYRTLLPDVVTLPQLFLANGYFTASVGKVFHKGQVWRNRKTWVVESYPTGNSIGLKGKGRRVTGGRFLNDRWLAAKGDDADQTDGAAALEAVRLLEETRDRPFFIAVGFHRPHPPHRAPRADFRRYKLPTFPFDWDGLPGPDVPNQAIPNPATARILESMSLRDRRELMRGYHAAATFVDRQFGLLIDTLDRLDLWRSTIVVVVSDHGYHLGEHGWWGKSTLWEESLRVPLLVHAPGLRVAGKRSPRPVELVDVYPTLTDLAGLEVPFELEGRSLRLLMKQPNRPWFPAFSQETRDGVIARSVRDDHWRYTEWGPGAEEVELYDLDSDPAQKVNLAGDPTHATTRAALARLLAEG